MTYNADHLLSEIDVTRISIFFTINAIILGNSIAIGVLFSGNSLRSRNRRKLNKIFNNQAFLIGNYAFLGFKISFMILVAVTFDNLDYGLNNSLWFVVPFIYVGLFLESVKSLRKYLKRYDIKRMILHFIALSIIGLFLSFINQSSYNYLGREIQKDFPYIQVPSMQEIKILDDQQYGYNSYYPHEIKIDMINNELHYWLGRQKVSADELYFEIATEHDHNRSRDIIIFALADIPYNKLKNVEWHLAYHGINKIYYKVFDSTTATYKMHKKNLFFTRDMFKKRKDSLPSPLYFANENLKDFKRTNFRIPSKEKFNSLNIKKYFKREIDSLTSFDFQIDSNVTLQNYLNFMNTYRSAVYELRAEDERLSDALNEISHSSAKYPMRYVESE